MLNRAAFAPFGDVLDCSGPPDKLINAGLCERFHDRARLDFGPDGRAGISLFNAVPRDLPYTFNLLERHPQGSQAFIPMTANPFLVIVAPDTAHGPGAPLAFLTEPFQGVNFHVGTWHGVLTPLAAPGYFAVIDRIGETANLEEVFLDSPYRVLA
jgi:ureidoglycolate lyase